MIPHDYITEWRHRAPWTQDVQVEQDLIISRALIEIFSRKLLGDNLAFRGGTALYKLYLRPLIHGSANQSGNRAKGESQWCTGCAQRTTLPSS